MIALASCSSACLPERENPFDPENAPIPELQILDRSTSAGGCLGLETIATWPAVAEASRGACLALDGRGSHDPQDVPLAEMVLRFERVDADGAVLATYAGTGTAGAIALLPDGAVRDLLDGELAHFQLTATEGGAAVSTTVRLQARNRRPEVTLDPPRSLPVLGAPWAAAPGEPIAVDFHARATDPDGDTSFTWTWFAADGSPIAGVTSSNATFSVTTDTTRRDAYFVVANDGEYESRPIAATVQVGPQNLWGTKQESEDAISFFTRVTRFDSDARSFTELDADPAPYLVDGRVVSLQVAETGSGTHLVVAADGDLLLARYPDAFVLDQTQASAQTVHVTPSGRIWTAGVAGSSAEDSQLLVAAFREESGVLVQEMPELAFSTGTEPGLVGALDVHMAEDVQGRLWIAPPFGRTLLVVDPVSATTSASIARASGATVTGLAAAPDGSIWATEGPSIFGGTAEAALVRYRTEGGLITAERFPLESSFVSGVDVLDSERLWVFIAERGACIVDATVLEAAEDALSSLEHCTPSLVTLHNAVVDPVTQAAWWNSLSADLAFRIEPDGSGEAIAAGGKVVRSIDPSGRYWYTRHEQLSYYASEIGYSRAPSESGVLLDEPTSAAAVMADGQGGFWHGTFDPATLVRVSETGEIRDIVTEAEVDGAPVELPLLLGLDVRGDDELAVAGLDVGAGEGVIYLLDLRSPRAVPWRVPAVVVYRGPEIGFFSFGQPFGIAGPLSSTRHAWMRTQSLLGTSRLYHFTRDGTQDVATELMASMGDDEWDAASPPAGGDFCFARRTSGDAVELYRGFPDPAASLVLTTAFAPSANRHLRGVAASSTPGADEDLCWYAISGTSGLQILAYDAALTPVRSHFEPGVDARDIVAFGPDDVWILREDAAGLARPTHVHFTGSTGTSEPGLPPVSATGFLEP